MLKTNQRVKEKAFLIYSENRKKTMNKKKLILFCCLLLELQFNALCPSLTGWCGKPYTNIVQMSEWMDIPKYYAKQRTFTQISPKWEKATEWVEFRAKSKRRKNKLFVTFSVSGRFVLLRTGSLNVESTPCLHSLLYFNFRK